MKRESFLQRRKEVIRLSAELAYRLPMKDGLWFSTDIRDNLYYAAHLFAAAFELDESIPFPKEKGIEKAAAVLSRFFRLQDRNMGSDMYGHWPMNAPKASEKLKPHRLTVEFTGCFLVFFEKLYGEFLPEETREELGLSIHHLYQSKIFLNVTASGNHHEAKWRAMQILLGWRFKDKSLFGTGHARMKELLAHIEANGMKEYGSLPWFWHWIQAFTFVRETVDDEEVRNTAEKMLEALWTERATYYLKGAWTGAHSRCLPHDVPEDRNNLHDYIQFGDFSLPNTIDRLEAAGLPTWQLPEAIRQIGVQRDEPVEVKKLLPSPVLSSGKGGAMLHSYTYITKDYAVGGVYEYVEEFLNEQHRWEATLPVNDLEGSNQAFFYRPGEGHTEGDERHWSSDCEALYHRSTVAALYYGTEETNNRMLIGCLPKGAWLEAERALYGKRGNVYLTVYLMNDASLLTKDRYLQVNSEGVTNGVVVEVMSEAEAADHAVFDLTTLRKHAEERRPDFTVIEGHCGVRYITFEGNELFLQVKPPQPGETVPRGIVREIDGKAIRFDDYKAGVKAP